MRATRGAGCIGNYSGLTQSDENGRTSPNVGRLFDYPAMMFQDGGTPALGPLATDRPHQFKTQFIYQFGFGTSLGVNEYIASGLPVSREVGILPPNNYPVNYLGRLSDGRTPMFSQTDLFVQHTFKVAGDKGLQLSLNVLNLLNQDTAVGKHSTYQKTGTDGARIDEVLFYTGRQTIAWPARSGHQGSALPDGQRVPGADSRSLRREVHVLDERHTVRLSSAPWAQRPAGRFHLNCGGIMRIVLALTVALCHRRLAGLSRQTSADSRARPHAEPPGLGADVGASRGRAPQSTSRMRSTSTRRSRSRTTDSAAPTWR